MKHDSSLHQGHVLKRYDEDMRKLQKRVLKMGRLVREQMSSLQQVLKGSSEESTEQVEEGDRTVDLLEVKVDKFIIRLLARRSPVGGDLRFIITASRIVTDLERLGDETVQMARVLDREYGNLGECDGRSVENEVRELLILLTELFDQAMLGLQAPRLPGSQGTCPRRYRIRRRNGHAHAAAFRLYPAQGRRCFPGGQPGAHPAFS